MPSIQDVLVSARKKLIADAGFQALLGVDVGQDADGEVWSDGWVFKGTNATNAPERNPEGTGQSTITMHMNDTWSSPNVYNTLSFRQLHFDIISDPSRQAVDASLIKSRDAELRCDRVATAIKTVFNDVGNVDHLWPDDTRIISCVLYNDLRIDYIPNKDGLVEGSLSFALELG